jgi:hypothetical protein
LCRFQKLEVRIEGLNREKERIVSIKRDISRVIGKVLEVGRFTRAFMALDPSNGGRQVFESKEIEDFFLSLVRELQFWKSDNSDFHDAVLPALR